MHPDIEFTLVPREGFVIPREDFETKSDSKPSLALSLSRLADYLFAIGCIVIIGSLGTINTYFSSDPSSAEMNIISTGIAIVSFGIGAMITQLCSRAGVLGIIRITKARMLDIAPELIKPASSVGTNRLASVSDPSYSYRGGESPV
jgi:hypothetical protein